VLLVRRSQDADSFAGSWEIPGGRLLPEETPVEGLRRELLEELGAEADIGRPVDVWDFVSFDSVLVVGITFQARIDPHARLTLSQEHDAQMWATLAEVRQLPMSESLRHQLQQHLAAASGEP